MSNVTDFITETVTEMVSTPAPTELLDTFNYTGMYISIGILGGFMFFLVLCGVCRALFGNLELPSEEKEPLANDEIPVCDEFAPETKPDVSDAAPSNGKPPEYDTAWIPKPDGSAATTRDVAVEVYEQDIDLADEQNV